MLVTNPFRLAVALLRNAALPALTCLALLCGRSADAAPAAKRPASGSHSAALRAKSFGPEATKTAARPTVQQLPAHPGGLPHQSPRPSPGDALPPRQTKSRGESSPKEMPQPIVALRGSPRPTGSGDRPSGNPSSSDPDLPRGADPRTNPSDTLPQKPEFPKLMQRHDVKVLPWVEGRGTPATAAEADRRLYEARRIRNRILESLRRGVHEGLYFEPPYRSDPYGTRQIWDQNDLPALEREIVELEILMQKFREAVIHGRTEPGPIRPMELFERPRMTGIGEWAGITQGGTPSGQGGFPLVPNGQQSNQGGSSGRREGANHLGNLAVNHPDHESHGGERGSNQDQNSSGSGPTPPEEHRITSTGPDASSSRQEPSTAKETTKKDNTSDKKTPAEDVKKDPMESQKKQTQQTGLPTEDGSSGGNDVGGHDPRRVARDNRGGLQQLLNPDLRAVGTTTGADDAARPIVGRGGTTNPSGNDSSNLNDVRGRRGNNSRGAQVPGPTEGLWWYLNGTRGQPRQ